MNSSIGSAAGENRTALAATQSAGFDRSGVRSDGQVDRIVDRCAPTMAVDPLDPLDPHRRAWNTSRRTILNLEIGCDAPPGSQVARRAALDACGAIGYRRRS
ncbi:MAG: hypothetical protein DI564_15870 [Rhodanobacter denitrificans]|uniref:Uncharacterized protein n=1 Tax=Rhodanobacter denitrificans TaxID=666685 RepID=A0A2W5LT07_9GAMM|nr:MAG: hypothetical protein DI564_15870 [Rhodanobacter denitrificans]